MTELGSVKELVRCGSERVGSSAGNADGDELRKSVVRKVSRRVEEKGKWKLRLRCCGGTEVDGETWVQDDSHALEVSEKIRVTFQ